MGIYQKFGVRKLALVIIDFITWIRIYKLKSGLSIFRSLQKSNNGFFKIETKDFLNPIWLRDNYSDKAIFYQVFYQQQYEQEQLFQMKARYIVDAGANIGLASVYFSKHFPDAQIVALEPQIDNFNLLKKNVTAYPSVDCLYAALWYQNETIIISNPESLAASFMVEASTEADVPALTINSLLQQKNWPFIDVLKIDIEGAEKEIFSTNTDWLKKVKVLIIELHDNYKPGCTKTFFKAIENYNYSAVFHHENIFVFFDHL